MENEDWVEWIEPFGPNNEPVYLRVPTSTAIAVSRKLHDYKSDQDALDDFIVGHWASLKKYVERK